MAPRKKCGEMRLDQALGLYIGLYVVAFFTSWFVSIPMLIHVGRNHECLLFVPPAIEYGPPTACFTVGLLPLFSALFIFILIALHIWQLLSLKRYLRNPDIPHSSKDYHNRPTHIFWRMVVFHGVVTMMMLITVAVLTSGYATTCQNVTRDLTIKVRGRYTKDRYGGGNIAGNRQGSGYGDYGDRYADQRSLEKYSNPQQTNLYGQNVYEQAITCRAVLTDIEYTKIFKSKHEQNLLYRQYYTPNQQNQPVADFGNLRYLTYRDNLILELSMAGSWICFVLLAVIMVLMTTQRHHLQAHIRDESMWGGSEYGRRSVSRFSNHSYDRGSQYSHQSGSRYSASKGGGGRRSRAPSEQPHNYSANNSYRQNPRDPLPLPTRQHHPPTHAEPNGLLSYFAENPPVDEEVDIDAALNDQSLDDMMEPQPDNLDGGPMQIKDTSFGSEGLPVPGLDQTFGDPIPLGDEVSSGRISGQLAEYPAQVVPRDPNRVTGRRGGRHSSASSRTPQQQTASYAQEIRQSTQERYEYRSPPSGHPDMSYRTHLGNQSMI